METKTDKIIGSIDPVQTIENIVWCVAFATVVAATWSIYVFTVFAEYALYGTV